MLTKLLTLHCKNLKAFSFLLGLLLVSLTALPQVSEPIIIQDTLKISTDTLKPDTLDPVPSFLLEAKVDYSSKDSIFMDLKTKKAHLFQSSKIDYKEIKLDAAYIEINFVRNTLFAKGLSDSLGKITGKPHFSEGSLEYVSEEMTYNFTSKKGLIKHVITQEGDGFLHGETVKKMANNETNVKEGLYTTCSHEHPHFQIKFFKAKVIPKKRIVTGPAYLVIEDVPTPLFVPFGYFPITKGRADGILIPTYGEEFNRGFFLENGGYYFGVGDQMDFALRGDIYSRGSWAVKLNSTYHVRYKFRSIFSISYATNIIGEKNAFDYSKNKDFFIRWSHIQSPQARPNSQFSASVNAGSSKFNSFNPTSTNDYLSNTYQSNISYSTRLGSAFNFSANFRHSQNTLSRQVDLSLPELTLNSERFYPLRKKVMVGNLKWYENISVGYGANARNEISTFDTLLFKSTRLSDFRNGVQHSIPISSSIKLLKYFNITNSVNYQERWYLNTIRKEWDSGILINGSDTIYGYVRTDTINEFKSARDFSFSSNLDTRIYGMINLKKTRLKAVRHVLNPSLGFSFRPDFGTSFWGYYKNYTDGKTNKEVPYSIFSNGIYGSPIKGKSGNLYLNIGNNLEIKVRSKKDTITGMKKIILLESFNFSTSYDFARDSLNLSQLSIGGRTTLWKNLLISYNSIWDPYAVNSTTGVNINKFEWTENRRLYRKNSNSWDVGLNWVLSSDMNKPKKEIKSEKGSSQELEDIKKNPDNYIDYSNPWRLNINYTFKYDNRYDAKTSKYNNELIQSISISGDVSITSKWKVAASSNYDFKERDFSYTSIDVYRDLHCWEMRFNWVPYGFRKSYNMTIKVKAPVLQDLKLTKKKDWRDF